MSLLIRPILVLVFAVTGLFGCVVPDYYSPGGFSSTHHKRFVPEAGSIYDSSSHAEAIGPWDLPVEPAAGAAGQ